MNTLKRQLDIGPNSILRYRQHQYDLIPYIIRLSFNYLRRLGLKFDPANYREEVIESDYYHTANHFAKTDYKVRILPIDKQKEPFLHIAIPKLIDKQFYELNGALYVPGFYINDLPLAVKKRSILCYGLFNSLTLYAEDSRVIFLGHNIPIGRFLNIFLNEQEVALACSEQFLDCSNINEKRDVSIRYMANLLKLAVPDLELIKARINDIFFDEWTLNLYKEYYNLDFINMDILIRNLLFTAILDKDNRSFIDLHYKRLIFIEYILSPFLRSVAATSKFIINNQDIYRLNITSGDIIKNFFVKLDKFNYYNVVNGFSGLLDLKATFKIPNAGDNLPISVSSIHSSYRDKIDVISISNTKPGQVINLTPNQNLRSLTFGIFDFENEK
jgi:hypothetical protein